MYAYLREQNLNKAVFKFILTIKSIYFLKFNYQIGSFILILSSKDNWEKFSSSFTISIMISFYQPLSLETRNIWFI